MWHRSWLICSPVKYVLKLWCVPDSIEYSILFYSNVLNFILIYSILMYSILFNSCLYSPLLILTISILTFTTSHTNHNISVPSLFLTLTHPSWFHSPDSPSLTHPPWLTLLASPLRSSPLISVGLVNHMERKWQRPWTQSKEVNSTAQRSTIILLTFHYIICTEQTKHFLIPFQSLSHGVKVRWKYCTNVTLHSPQDISRGWDPSGGIEQRARARAVQ